jgi:Alpha-L-arabinofuranosidase B (ABFB) domain
MKCLITAAILGCLLVTSAWAEPPVVAEIRLDATPAKCLSGQPGKAAEMSAAHARKFRILPGLSDTSLVSLEAVGFTGVYMRHQKFVFYLQPRPKHVNPLFDSDATFTMHQLDDNKVRFEASNYPGKFISVMDDGAVVLSKDPAPAQSTFVLKKE